MQLPVDFVHTTDALMGRDRFERYMHSFEEDVPVSIRMNPLKSGKWMVDGGERTPILLLDDIFDKLDAQRVEKIVELVASDQFGQIFITDTNRDHIDRILSQGQFDYKLYEVKNGEIYV